MPSPIGHALGGAIVALVGMPTHADRVPPARALLWTSAAAVLPDVDFLWGRHSMETHSLGAAVLAGLVVLASTRGRGGRVALLIAVAWASHVLFDWLGSDDTPPLGVMALWPLTSDFYFAHAYLFEAISRRTWLPNFWSHNMYAVAREIAILAPVAGAGWALRWRRRGTAVVGRELREGKKGGPDAGRE